MTKYYTEQEIICWQQKDRWRFVEQEQLISAIFLTADSVFFRNGKKNNITRKEIEQTIDTFYDRKKRENSLIEYVDISVPYSVPDIKIDFYFFLQSCMIFQNVDSILKEEEDLILKIPTKVLQEINLNDNESLLQKREPKELIEQVINFTHNYEKIYYTYNRKNKFYFLDVLKLRSYLMLLYTKYIYKVKQGVLNTL